MSKRQAHKSPVSIINAGRLASHAQQCSAGVASNTPDVLYVTANSRIGAHDEKLMPASRHQHCMCWRQACQRRGTQSAAQWEAAPPSGGVLLPASSQEAPVDDGHVDGEQQHNEQVVKQAEDAEDGLWDHVQR